MLSRKIVVSNDENKHFGTLGKNVIQYFLTIILEEITMDTKFWGRRHTGKPHH